MPKDRRHPGAAATAAMQPVLESGLKTAMPPRRVAELAALADKSGRGPEHDLITELISNTRYPSFNTKSIGRFLGKHVDRIVGGYVLLSEPDGSGAKKYQVRDVSAKTQGKPDGGTSPF